VQSARVSGRGRRIETRAPVRVQWKALEMFKFLMAPSNAVCDRFGLTDEHERGMLRMLVNMLIFAAIVVAVFYVAWRTFA
jgi:hypothetical protein